MMGIDFWVLTKKRPEKRLVFGKKGTCGRNSQGRITSRFRGGGVKRLLRTVDFGQAKLNVPGTVAALEYDPNRTAFIALVSFRDGDKRYILAPKDMKAGDSVLIADRTPIRVGSRMKLKNIPIGTQTHNIELFPGKGGQVVRSAGSAAMVLAQEGTYTHLVLPSREVRRFPSEAFASVGSVSNQEWVAMTWGKAGRSRWLGRMPRVRGSAMNPVDHPHGGGEGRAPIGLKYPKTPWGKHARGVKTRWRHKASNKLIVQRRAKK